MQRHFGPKPRMFGKKVYGVGGDVVGHDGFEGLINGVPTVRMKPFTKAGEQLTPGATGVVPKGCYFAATPPMDGFDSRYAETELGRASCRERVCRDVWNSVVAV